MIRNRFTSSANETQPSDLLFKSHQRRKSTSSAVSDRSVSPPRSNASAGSQTSVASTPRREQPLKAGHATKMENMADYDKRLAREGRWLLIGNTQVLEPDDFLRELFNEDTSNSSPAVPDQSEPSFENSNIPEEYLDAFKNIRNGKITSEKDMYTPLVNAFNTCIFDSANDTRYYCFDTSTFRSEVGTGTSVIAQLGPDLIITPDYTPRPSTHTTRNSNKWRPFISSDTNVFNLRHVSCEVKFNWKDDCGFPKGVVTQEDLRKLSKEQGSLILQSLRYIVLGQFSSLPYRHVLHITITGHLLRIWKFSPTGCRVTTAINYIDDPKPIVSFIGALKRSPPAAIGSDIDLGGVFQVPPASLPSASESLTKQHDTIQKGLGVIAKLYQEQSGDREWSGSKKPWSYWLFDPTSDSKNQYSPFEDSVAYNESLCVFPNPIYYTCSMTSRATRCYLAVERSFLLSENFKKTNHLQNLNHIHVLKTAWQNPDRVSEVHFHSEFVRRREMQSITDPTNVATILAGGTISGTEHTQGRTLPVDLFRATEPQSTEESSSESREDAYHQIPVDNNSNSQAHLKEAPQDPAIDEAAVEHLRGAHPPDQFTESRELRWVLFKEVGGKLSGCTNVGELITAFIDAINAHEDLTKVGILHRDISPNNIMINLSTGLKQAKIRGGLLIDLDMAKDLREESVQTRPELTGTLLFMSLQLANRIYHAPWHDLESMFWVLIWFVIRNIGDVTLFWWNAPTSGTPADILDTIFSDPGTLAPLKDVTQCRESFLNHGRLAIAHCESLQTAIEHIHELLWNLYAKFNELNRNDTNFEKLRKKLNNPPELKKDRNFSFATSTEDLEDLLMAMKEDLENLLKASKGLSLPRSWHKEVQTLQKIMQNNINQIHEETIQFPTYDEFLEQLQGAMDDAAREMVTFKPANAHGDGHLNVHEPTRSHKPNLSHSSNPLSNLGNKRKAPEEIENPVAKKAPVDPKREDLASPDPERE